MSKKEKIVGTCRLCKQKMELQGSHIIPKMFYDLIKRNSLTARIRGTDNPNIPIQDGVKIPFLCHECEEKFSNYETGFSRIYRNYAGSFGTAEFDSDSDILRYFLLSIGWRVLQYLREKDIKDLTVEEYEAIDSKLEEWRLALWNEDHESIRKQKQYIIPTTRLSYFNKFPTRRISNIGFDFHPFGPENSFRSAFSTTQIPYLLFLSMVWGEEKLLADYEIGKKIVPADFQLPETLNWQLDEFHINKFGDADQALSDSQREKIEDLVSAKTKGVVSVESLSEAYQRILKDTESN